MHQLCFIPYLAVMSNSFKRHLTPSPENNRKPCFFVQEHHGQLQLVIRLALEVEDVQALQHPPSLKLRRTGQLSRGVVAAAIHDIAKLANLPRRIKLKAP